MFDTARIETSLEAKRQDLAAKISEGRTVIETLAKRHAEMGRKIDMATSAVDELERQLSATNTVINMFDREGLILSRDPLEPAPVAHVPPPMRVAAPVVSEEEGEGFKPLSYLRCLNKGHDMVFSRQVAGKVTCRRCRMRRDA